MKEILFALLMLSLTSNSALFPAGERAVVIRIDDIQDYGQPSPYSKPEKMLLQYHVQERIPAIVAIIPTRFGEDPQLIDLIKEGLALKVFTIAAHGWHHNFFTNLSRNVQVTEMGYAKAKLEAVFDTPVLAFVPPYNEFNEDTIYAAKKNGLTMVSSSVYTGDIPRQEDGIAFLPQTVTTAVVVENDTWAMTPLEAVTQEIQDSWDSYGVAVLVIHPRQFVGADSDSRWLNYTRMMQWVTGNEGRVVGFEPRIPETRNNIDPFLISVGIFAGLTSTLLIAFNVSAKRSARRSSEGEVGGQTPKIRHIA